MTTVRNWLIEREVDGVGSRGVISRTAWAEVARAANAGTIFDDYDPSIPGKITKPDVPTEVRISIAPRKVDLENAYVAPKPWVKVRQDKQLWTFFTGSDKVVLGFATCSRCVRHITYCPCDGGPKPPRYTTGEVFTSHP